MRECCERAWIGAAISAEGCLQVWKQTSRNMPTKAFGMKVMVYNSDPLFIARCYSILDRMEVRYRTTSRLTSKIGRKVITEIHIQQLDSVIRLLTQVHEHLAGKEEFSLALLGLALSRKASREAAGERAPWTNDQIRLAEGIRRVYMPYRTRANGETLSVDGPRAIPSEALGSVDSTRELLESRVVSSTSDNRPHERPASRDGMMMCSDPQGDLGVGRNAHEDIARA